MDAPACVAITGIDTRLGQRLAERLLALAKPPRVVGVGPRRPPQLAGRIVHHPVDLTRPALASTLAELLAHERVDALAHLAFRESPGADSELDHELETIGSLQLFEACACVNLRRLVVASSTMLYGPRPDNPNFLGEDHALAGHPKAHCVQNRVQVEHALADWIPRHPDTEVSVLRSCWVMGAQRRDAVARYFARSVVPVVLGYDPLLQFIHEDDLLDVYEQALLRSHPGVFNVVGRGVLPLSMLLALAGKRRLPLPPALLYRMPPHAHLSADPPAGFYDYLRYLWVAAGERGWQEFGEPVYSTREAWIAFVSATRRRGPG